MIPCSTYLVQQGWFDIFFPTDFESLKKLYDHVMKGSGAESHVSTHRKFLECYSKCLKDTETKSGENPMLIFFENVKFFESSIGQEKLK